MADASKTPDPAILASSLLRLRQGGAAAAPLSERRQKIKRILGALTGATQDPRAFLGAPSMSIFKALAQGPKALAAACQSSPDALVDTPLDQAVRLSGLSGGKEFRPTTQLLRLTALQLCAMAELWREARVLLAHGADPNLFNAAVTPIGMAAYCGSARVLCEMISFGANATLYLSPEHAPLDAGSHGSTLLHRVASRLSVDNKRAVLLILAHCAASYPDPLPEALDGQTPLDWAADDETAETILSAVADREARALRLAAPPRGKSKSQRRM